MSMERSRQQVLYQFLPGNTFDYSDKRGIWQVNRLETTDASGNVDRQYIVDRVFARAKNWEGGEQGFNSAIPITTTLPNPTKSVHAPSRLRLPVMFATRPTDTTRQMI
jgi:hypothetical protein